MSSFDQPFDFSGEYSKAISKNGKNADEPYKTLVEQELQKAKARYGESSAQYRFFQRSIVAFTEIYDKKRGNINASFDKLHEATVQSIKSEIKRLQEDVSVQNEYRNPEWYKIHVHAARKLNIKSSIVEHIGDVKFDFQSLTPEKRKEMEEKPFHLTDTTSWQETGALLGEEFANSIKDIALFFGSIPGAIPMLLEYISLRKDRNDSLKNEAKLALMLDEFPALALVDLATDWDKGGEVLKTLAAKFASGTQGDVAFAIVNTLGLLAGGAAIAGKAGALAGKLGRIAQTTAKSASTNIAKTGGKLAKNTAKVGVAGSVAIGGVAYAGETLAVAGAKIAKVVGAVDTVASGQIVLNGSAVLAGKMLSVPRNLRGSMNSESYTKMIEKNASLDPPTRANETAKTLGLPRLSDFQNKQLQLAHTTGKSGAGEWTYTELQAKYEALMSKDPNTGKPAFTKEQSRTILEQGYAGKGFGVPKFQGEADKFIIAKSNKADLNTFQSDGFDLTGIGFEGWNVKQSQVKGVPTYTLTHSEHGVHTFSNAKDVQTYLRDGHKPSVTPVSAQRTQEYRVSTVTQTPGELLTRTTFEALERLPDSTKSLSLEPLGLSGVSIIKFKKPKGTEKQYTFEGAGDTNLYSLEEIKARVAEIQKQRGINPSPQALIREADGNYRAPDRVSQATKIPKQEELRRFLQGHGSERGMVDLTSVGLPGWSVRRLPHEKGTPDNLFEFTIPGQVPMRIRGAENLRKTIQGEARGRLGSGNIPEMIEVPNTPKKVNDEPLRIGYDRPKNEPLRIGYDRPIKARMTPRDTLRAQLYELQARRDELLKWKKDHPGNIIHDADLLRTETEIAKIDRQLATNDHGYTRTPKEKLTQLEQAELKVKIRNRLGKKTRSNVDNQSTLSHSDTIDTQAQARIDAEHGINPLRPRLKQSDILGGSFRAEIEEMIRIDDATFQKRFNEAQSRKGVEGTRPYETEMYDAAAKIRNLSDEYLTKNAKRMAMENRKAMGENRNIDTSTKATVVAEHAALRSRMKSIVDKQVPGLADPIIAGEVSRTKDVLKKYWPLAAATLLAVLALSQCDGNGNDTGSISTPDDLAQVLCGKDSGKKRGDIIDKRVSNEGAVLTEKKRENISLRYMVQPRWKEVVKLYNENKELLEKSKFSDAFEAMLRNPSIAGVQHIQRWIGMEEKDNETAQDGILGPNTAAALIKFMNTCKVTKSVPPAS
ncbi:hypothetical protein KBC86_00905 [Candidatus Gracilibacteria bacterium]|nr:hypothetical protein [Candidatus Gracilibacteria bacterium]